MENIYCLNWKHLDVQTNWQIWLVQYWEDHFQGKYVAGTPAHTKPTNASPHRPEPRSVPSTQLLSHLRGGACRGRKVGPEPMGAAWPYVTTAQIRSEQQWRPWGAIFCWSSWEQ